MQKENPRLDLVSRLPFPKEELFRLVKKDGSFVYDKEGRFPGRGYYLHKDEATLEIAKRKGVLERKGNVPEGLFEELEGDL